MSLPDAAPAASVPADVASGRRPLAPGAWRARLAAPLRRGAGWLAAQLVIVFLGVYAAAWVADREADRARDRRRLQLRRALVLELRDVVRGTRGAAAGTGRIIAYYDSAWAAGGQPRLEPILDPVGVTPHIWEATVAGGGVELLDLPTFLRLSAFYNELRAGFDLLSQLRVLSETELVPLGDAPGSAFYDPATRRLRRRFAWYPANVRRLHALAKRLTVHGESLVTALDAPLP
jgi:hypothetical protein